MEIPKSVDKIGTQAFTGNPLKTVTLDKDLFDTIRKQSGGLEKVFGDTVTTYQDHDGTKLSVPPAKKPSAVTSPSDTKSGTTVTITAMPPSNRGTLKGGAVVGEKNIIYWLYYALVGYTPPSKTKVTTSTTETDVTAAVGKVTGTSNKNIGRIEITGNAALTTGFTLTGLTGGAEYRYTIVSIHPKDATLTSAYTTGTVTIQSKATAGPAFTLNTPTGTTNSGFTIRWNTGAFDAIVHKKVSGDALGTGDMSYKVYYASSGTPLNAASIKTAALTADKTAANTGGIKTVGRMSRLQRYTAKHLWIRCTLW